MTIKKLSSIFILSFSFFFIFLSCENAPSQPKQDIEYNIDDVRILLPREFQKMTSQKEILQKFFPNQKIENLNPLNKISLDALADFNNHNWFVKFENDKLEWVTLKTDEQFFRAAPDNTSRVLEIYENAQNQKYMTPDSTYRHVLIDDKIKGAHMVQFYKYKYFHSKEGNDWFTTDYSISANSRTISVSIFSPNKNYNDLENHMQFIQIKKQ